MREAERALVRVCIEENLNMPFDEIMERTNLSQEKVSMYLSDVIAEAGNWKKFFGDDETNENVVSPWDLAIGDEILDRYKKEIDEKTNRIKPMLVMKMYTELEQDKKTAQKKLEMLSHSPHQGSRWLELKLKARNDQIKLLALDAPQKHEVNLSVSRSKEDRDKIFQAAQAKNLIPQIEGI